MLIPLASLAERRTIVLDRIVHAGAHLGEEAADYHQLGAGNVLWVEGNPDIIEKLRANVAPYGHAVAQALVGADEGREVAINASNFDSMSSSVLEFGTHAQVFSEAVFVGDQKHRIQRLDDVAAAHGFDGADLLNIDLQGHELECLRGAPRLVESASTIYVEVNVDPLYPGCVLLSELDEWLVAHGFEAAEVVLAGSQRRAEPGFVGWGDCCYVRVDAPRTFAAIHPEEAADWFSPYTAQPAGLLRRAGHYVKREGTYIAKWPRSLSPSRVWGELQRLEEEVINLRNDLGRASDELARTSAELARVRQHEDRINEVEAHRILATMAWIDSARVRTDDMVSVITPTWNRAALLERAIASVRAQSYPNWEMLIADDGSEDDTADVIASFDDSRITHLKLEHGGAARARNAAVRAAKGRVLAFVDSDNQLHSAWLRSVMWALDQNLEIDVVYGAQVRETDAHMPGVRRLNLPAIWFKPFDRGLLERTSFMDLSCMAHRAGLAEQFFDESYLVTDDFERALRLTRDKPALGIPVFASLYRMTGDDQISLSRSEVRDEEYARIMRAHGIPT